MQSKNAQVDVYIYVCVCVICTLTVHFNDSIDHKLQDILVRYSISYTLATCTEMTIHVLIPHIFYAKAGTLTTRHISLPATAQGNHSCWRALPARAKVPYCGPLQVCGVEAQAASSAGFSVFVSSFSLLNGLDCQLYKNYQKSHF